MTPAGRSSRFQPDRVSRRARGPQDRDAPPDGGGLRPVLTAAARAALLPSGQDGETDLSRTEKQPFTQAAALAGIGRKPAGEPLQSPPEIVSVSGNNFLMRSVTLSIADMTSPKGALIHSPITPFSRK
jgi:hypothetical protein